MLSITNENLRRIILEEIQLLTEITYASAVNNLGAKKMRKGYSSMACRSTPDLCVKSFAAGRRTIDELTPEEEAEIYSGDRVGHPQRAGSSTLCLTTWKIIRRGLSYHLACSPHLATYETGYLGHFLEGNYPGSEPILGMILKCFFTINNLWARET